MTKPEFKFKRYQKGMYTSKSGEYSAVVELDEYACKWYADLKRNGEDESWWECATKREAIQCVNSYFGQ